MSARWFRSHIPRALHLPISRIFPNSERIPRCREQFCSTSHPLPITQFRCRAGWLPLYTGCRIPMVRIHERHEIRIVCVVIFNQDALILQANNSYAVTEILGERANGKSKCGSRTLVLAWRRRFAPVERVDRPCKSCSVSSRRVAIWRKAAIYTTPRNLALWSASCHGYRLGFVTVLLLARQPSNRRQLPARQNLAQNSHW